MATTYKVLAQAAPSTTSNNDLYTVGSGKSAVISTLAITNVTQAAASCRIYIRVAGATASNANCFAYDVDIQGNDVNPITIGITLAETDVITVRSSVPNALTFHVFGSEIA